MNKYTGIRIDQERPPCHESLQFWQPELKQWFDGHTYEDNGSIAYVSDLDGRLGQHPEHCHPTGFLHGCPLTVFTHWRLNIKNMPPMK